MVPASASGYFSRRWARAGSVQRALETIRVRIRDRSACERRVHKLPIAPAELHARIEQSDARAAARLGELLKSHAQTQLRFIFARRLFPTSEPKREIRSAGSELAPVWQELTEARRELDGLDSLAHFPLDCEQRLDSRCCGEAGRPTHGGELVGHDTAPSRCAPSLDDATRGTSVSPTRDSAPSSTEGPVQDPSTPAPRIEAGTSSQRSRRCGSRQRALNSNTSRTVRELEAREISCPLPEPAGTAKRDDPRRGGQLVQPVRTTLAGLPANQDVHEALAGQIAERSAASGRSKRMSFRSRRTLWRIWRGAPLFSESAAPHGALPNKT